MNQSQAIELCRRIEELCPSHGCHVALTGGCLYKEGERKDLDLLFYRIRQIPEINLDGLFESLLQLGFEKPEGFGFCYKTSWCGTAVDLFFPESHGGTYDEQMAEAHAERDAWMWAKDRSFRTIRPALSKPRPQSHYGSSAFRRLLLEHPNLAQLASQCQDLMERKACFLHGWRKGGDPKLGGGGW